MPKLGIEIFLFLAGCPCKRLWVKGSTGLGRWRDYQGLRKMGMGVWDEIGMEWMRTSADMGWCECRMLGE